MAGSTDHSTRKPVVLLVDDEQALIDSLRPELQQVFDLEFAKSAEEADLMMATRTYDVVVSDHLMSGEEGLKFLVRVASVHPKTRRIMLTGYMNPELISRSVAVAGLSTCLVKPIHASELVAAIHTALRA